MKKKEMLTISQLSKLRNVPIDTLRYYDKADLFKPFYVDPTSGYRYYSIVQYENLGTIVELRNLGLSVENIKDYMDDRNTAKSLAILKKQQKILKQESIELANKVKTLASRITHIEHFQSQYESHHIIQKEFKARYYHNSIPSVPFDDAISFSYSVLSLEDLLNESLPLIANQRVGHVMDLDFLTDDTHEIVQADVIEHWKNLKVFLLEEGKPAKDSHEIAAGSYLCTTYNGLSKDRGSTALLALIQYCRDNNLTIAEQKAWNIIQIDPSITNLKDEAIYEIQLRIK